MTNIAINPIYYEIAGTGEPMIFAHAGFVDSRMWDAQWEIFQRHYQVIRYDLRGYGKSEVATEPIARHEELYTLMQTLGIERAHLVGCSLSGAAVLDFALLHPAMVLSLTLVSTVPNGFEMQGDPPPAMLEMFGAMQQGDWARVSELQVRLWFDGASRQASDVDAELRQAVAAMNQIAVNNGTFAIADMQPVRPLDPPAVKRLGEITVPTQVIVGALDHPEIERAGRLMVEQIDGAQFVKLANTAHLPNMEQAEPFNQAVLNFLKG